LGLSQITGGPFLPCAAGPWKWAMLAAPTARYSWGPGQHPPRRIIGQLGRPGGGCLHRRHLLCAVQRNARRSCRKISTSLNTPTHSTIP
jgi:hypothetical protein